MSLFALIPCYNAEKTLPNLLAELKAFIPPERTICVNDGSRDKTVTTLRKLDVKAYHFPKNQGKGAALKLGYELALKCGATAVLAIDSDHQHLPADIPKFLREASCYDIVVGSRRRNGRFGKPMPFPRVFSNSTTSAILSCLTKQRIEDAQCGFRLIHRRCLEDIVPLCKEKGFMFETEFLLHAAERGYKIGFVEIEVIYGTSASNMRYVADTFNFVKLVLRHWLKRRGR
ncbi:MAG: glycosyltransferase family 2 protein [Chloroherpetonaceae bacterium]|nr:glycosyltransferase family 2 protein [Chloroherpetonaceae bacterium]MDW8436562.1 glycosyltransferase family 2 protein [Chloroherpetonaceae bacterium]